MKTVIVTGASGNMGKAIVKKFLERGYFVVGTFVPNDNSPFEIEDLRFERATVDLLQEDDSASFVQAVAGKYGSIDTVVSTVGGFAMGGVMETSTQDINKQIRLNFETSYNIVRPAFLQMMKQRQGRIFMTGSRPGLHSFHANGMVAYSLGKSLVFRLADLLNDEAKGVDVVTSIIVPSTIDTPQNRQSMPAANFADWVKPQEIADIIFYHCSPEARALRETVIKVYGNT
ncbi:MAG TPA: SDR family NAD(P)-dependent oxidoreductase [Chitinophagaceae bacterium]|nr:SDR family NAD(P)-dependent oxidoreductase [Chitinophagaceae bacterium]